MGVQAGMIANAISIKTGITYRIELERTENDSGILVLTGKNPGLYLETGNCLG